MSQDQGPVPPSLTPVACMGGSTSHNASHAGEKQRLQERQQGALSCKAAPSEVQLPLYSGGKHAGVVLWHLYYLL